MLLLLLLLSVFVCQSAAAVLISTFDNCLSESTRDSPEHLQFHPILVAGSFDTAKSVNELEITVWGTVTGASSESPLGRRRRDLGGAGQLGSPSPQWGEKRQVDDGSELSSPLSQPPPTYFGGEYKADYRFPDKSIEYNFTGLILDQPVEWKRFATTLSSRVVVSSFQVYKNNTFFCRNARHDSSINTDCPFGNLKSAGDSETDDRMELMNRRLVPDNLRNNVTYLTQELPSFTFKRSMSSGYQFATLGVTLKIIAGDDDGTQVGCVHVEVTPKLQDPLKSALTWISAGLLIFVGMASIAAAMFNPWNGTTDVFRFSSNFGMDDDMLRLVTPGFADCLQWLQFIVLTGSLSLSYPGFYQPIVSNGAWSVLLLNTSFYSHNPVGAEAWKADGIYAPQAWAYGYERLAQAVGLLTTNDIWVSVMVYFAILLVSAVVIFQIWFWARWTIWQLAGVEEEDLTSRNWPFTVGLMYRFTFTYFLIPVLTACTFQFTVAGNSATVVTVLACVVLILILGVSAVLTYLIWTHRPRSELYDILPTLLAYGTFYNTYREKNLQFFIVQLYVNVLRATAYGALQPSGIAQITILAACEIVLILTLYGIKPFPPATSMNLWHVIFAAVRLLVILLMMAFVPSINATDAVKGWAGWVILGLHAAVLLFGFVLKALQTVLELIVRGYGSDEEAARGGFAKVFGVRQLSRRKRHSKQTHRSSSLTPTPISGTERKHTLTTASSQNLHSRTNSSAILLGSPTTEHPGLVIPLPDGSQSGHGHSNSGSTAAGYTPTTPGTVSGHGYPPPINNAAGPYYRPPRTRRLDGDQYSPAGKSRGSWTSETWGSKQRSSQGSLPPHLIGSQANAIPPIEPEGEGSYVAGGGGRATPSSARVGPGHRQTDSVVTVGSGRGNTDYAVREVDSYYRMRGPALSAQPARRLGTGPADPTGPISNAKSWIKQKLGLARGEKEKGFSVVRSSRAPDAILVAQRDIESGRIAAEDPSAGIGVALTSPDDEEQPASDTESEYSETEKGEPGPSTRMLEKRPQADHLELKPTVPRKSSKRRSREVAHPTLRQLYDPPISRGSGSRLPFEEEDGSRGDRSQSFSTTSSIMLEPPQLVAEGRPESVGEVHHGRISAVVKDERGNIRGSQAELVRGGSGSSNGGGGGGGGGQ